MVEEWQPEPLVTTSGLVQRKLPVLEGRASTLVTIGGVECVNLATFNFLGLVGDAKMETQAIATARKYGIGSCGPRGFYGTIDVHLNLEEAVATFMGVEEAILYSYGFSTIASVIPAYSKRDDVIFYDEECSFAIQQGLVASRSQLISFKHNDMADLERLLTLQAQLDRQDPKKAKAMRRLLVAEGLYVNTGQICPLKAMVELKYKYKFRLFLEESYSFGVLGQHGRGVTEHFGVPVDDVDAIAVCMGTSLASIGGFVCGSSYVIDHQRLSGLGYCFSASLPPLLASAAQVGLQTICDDAARRQSFLRKNAELLWSKLAAVKHMELSGDRLSPIMHLRLKKRASTFKEEEVLLTEIVDKALSLKVACTCAVYLTNRELHSRIPSIRLCVSSAHTSEEIELAAAGLIKAASTVLRRA